MFVADAILPIFIIMLFGFVAEKYHLLGSQGAYVLNRFVLYFGLPLLVFTSLENLNLYSMFNLRFISAFTLGMVTSFSVLILAKKFIYKSDSKAEITMKSLLSSLPNTAFMGIPILSVLVGTTGIVAAVITTILMFVLLLISLPWLEHETNKKINILQVVVSLFKQPIVIAMFAAFFFSATGLHLLSPIDATFQMIGNTATPCALFSIGATLAEDKITLKLKDTCIISIIKLAIQPIFTLILLYFFQVSAQWAISGVILSALPIATVAFIYAAQFNIYVKGSSSLIAITTILSAITLPVFILISGWVWH